MCDAAKENVDAFHSTQNSGNFGWCIKWGGSFRFGPTGIFGTSFESGPLWPVRLSRSVGPKCPFPFDKFIVPSTALSYRAYKNNNQTRGGLGRVCVTGMYRSIGHVEFPKFQTGMESALYFHVSRSWIDDYANSFWRQNLRSSACNLSVFAVLFNYSLLSNHAFFLRSVVRRVKQLTHIRKHSTT